MRLTVLVNDVPDLQARQATTLLTLRAAGRGHHVEVSGVRDLARGDLNGSIVRGRRAPGEGEVEDVIAALAAQDARPRALERGDVVLVRTNPARDAGNERFHAAAADLLRAAEEDGVLVLNPPDVLAQTGGKGYLMRLPAHLRPVSLVASQVEPIREFVADGPTRCVLKPLVGTRGIGIVKVPGGRAGAEEAARHAEKLLEHGPIMVQHYVPRAHLGDTRVLLVDGEPLTVGGHRGAVRRVPPKGDFRSNLAVGGRAKLADWSEALERVVADMAPLLRRDRVWLAGLDVVGDKVVEVNVHSPGGFGSAEDLEGEDFATALIDRLEQRAG